MYMYVIVLGLYSTINTEEKSLNEILRKLTRWFVDNPSDIGQRYIYSFAFQFPHAIRRMPT